MIGIYLSGTGNTKYCMEKLLSLIDHEAKAIPLESDGVIQKIEKNDTIMLGYSTQFSNAPYMVRDFIYRNRTLWNGKKVLCLVTMGAFSGDGAGCTARLLKKYDAVILGGVHIRMPNSICDSKPLKKNVEKNKQIVAQADKKMESVAQRIKQGRYPQDGISFSSHVIGLLGQRLWFYKKTAGYTDQLKIHADCNGCGLCASLCPMKNISMKNRKAVSGNQCTMCYRCISQCPQKAITLLGERGSV